MSQCGVQVYEVVASFKYSTALTVRGPQLLDPGTTLTLTRGQNRIFLSAADLSQLYNINT